jgi:hypothetical protein
VGSDPGVLRGGWWRENMPGPVIAGAGHLARLFNGAPHSTGAHCGRSGFCPNGHSRQVREREAVKSRGRHAQRAGREAHIKPGPQGRAGFGEKRQTRRSRVGWDGAARNGRHAGMRSLQEVGATLANSQTSEAGIIASGANLSRIGALSRDHREYRRGKGDGGQWPASRLRLNRVIPFTAEPSPEKNFVLPLPSVRRRTVS